MHRRMIGPGDEEWPAQLEELGSERPPAKLYLQGRELAPAQRMIAIVGARRPTAAGIEAAHSLATGLAQAGFVIVSGMAMGIDTIAHQAALQADGTTVAVLGCGLDVVYPRRNASLMARIAEQGTLVSEYDEGTRPLAQHFPQRNRIIAGLSRAVVYVEGAKRSGGRITARIALEANRAVFAVPGSIRNPLAYGPNELIRTSQAALVTDVAHIFEELAPHLIWKDGEEASVMPRVQLDDQEAEVLCLLDDAPVTLDAICRHLRVAPGHAALSLTRLEVRGLAARRDAGYVITGAGARVRAAHPAGQPSL